MGALSFGKTPLTFLLKWIQALILQGVHLVRLQYPVDPEKVTAKMTDGVLTVSMGKMDDRATTRNVMIE